MRAERIHNILDIQHDDELIRDELRAHVLSQREGLTSVETKQPGKREHDAAEDILQRDDRIDAHEQHVDAFCQCNEGDEIGADDQHQAAGAQDGVTEEGEKRLALDTLIIERSDDILFLADLDGVQQVRDNQGVDDVQGYSRDDELRGHHLGVHADQSSRDTAHGHHGERQATISLHAFQLQAGDSQRLRVAEEHHLDGEEGLELRLTREESEDFANPFDDKRQHTRIGQDIEERHDEEDWQQGRGEEVHLAARGMNPVRERERDTFIGYVDQPDEGRCRAGNNVAADGERHEEPGDEEIQRDEHADAAPVDILALFREEHADADEDQHAQQVNE